MYSNMFLRKLNTILAQDPMDLVASQTQKMTRLLEQIGDSFVLFGAGRLGRITLAGLRRAGIEPLAFADNSQKLWGQTVDGMEVHSPEKAREHFGSKALFVITVYTSSAVRWQLRKLDVNFVSFAELAWHYPQTLLPHYATDLPHSIFEQADAVKDGLALWADDTSRNEYLAQLAWRTSLDPDVLPPCLSPQDMYFQNDLFSIRPTDILVDCGAYDGDTIRELERQNVEFHRLIAIEPDPLNFRKLEAYLAGQPLSMRNKIAIHQNAIGATKEQLTFDATGTASTTMTPGSYSVESLPLDLLLMHEEPTYIKMDIEGAEYDAIRGGKGTIQKHLPILAICLYHSQQDLWRIPLLIRSISNRYELFLRRYADECWEQVCYAIPPERVVS